MTFSYVINVITEIASLFTLDTFVWVNFNIITREFHVLVCHQTPEISHLIIYYQRAIESIPFFISVWLFCIANLKWYQNLGHITKYNESRNLVLLVLCLLIYVDFFSKSRICWKPQCGQHCSKYFKVLQRTDKCFFSSGNFCKKQTSQSMYTGQ